MSFPILYRSLLKPILVTLALSVSLMTAASGAEICDEYLEMDAPIALDELDKRLAATRDQISNLRAAIEQGSIVITAGANSVTMTYEEAISKVIVSVLDDPEFDKFDTLQEALEEIVAYIAVAVKVQARALRRMEEELQELGACYGEVQAAAGRDRSTVISGMSLHVTVDDSEDFMRSKNQRIVISKSESSVTYLWEQPGCTVTWNYDISGAPFAIKNGDEFKINLRGDVSGECSSADGTCRSGMVVLRGGLEKAKDGVATGITIGVPQTGRAPKKACHIPSDSVSIPLRVTSDSSAVLEFRVGHGSGSRLVATYEWRAAEE